jgi:type IV pilus assembly protein PilM
MARRTAIGLDIGTSVVRAAEVSYGRAGTTLERFGQIVLPEGAVHDGEVVEQDEVVRCLHELWSATGFSHKRVVMGMANQRVIVRQLDLNWLEPEEFRASLPFQVQDYLPIPVDQAVLDFLPLEESVDESDKRIIKGLLVAAIKETVMTNVSCAQRAGLKVRSVDLSSFAVLRALGRRVARNQELGQDADTEALIDVGAGVTNVIVHCDGLPRFVRILLLGGQDVTDAVADELGLSIMEAEALKQQYAGVSSGWTSGPEADGVRRAVARTAQDFVDEIRGSLDYYSSAHPGVPVQRIVVSGGGSRLDTLAERLAAATRLPVVPGDPLRTMRIGKTGLDSDQLDFVRPLAAVPVGLALGAL